MFLTELGWMIAEIGNQAIIKSAGYYYWDECQDVSFFSLARVSTTQLLTATPHTSVLFLLVFVRVC
jgi:hypothetical protein